MTHEGWYASKQKIKNKKRNQVKPILECLLQNQIFISGKTWKTKSVFF